MKNIAKNLEDYEEEYNYSSSHKKQKMNSNKKVKKMKD